MESSLVAGPLAILAVALEVVAIYSIQPYANCLAAVAIVLGLIALGMTLASFIKEAK